jgi:hypothetical protein
MARNITLAIDDEVLDKARVIAAERRTTVNAMVREFLTRTAMEKDDLAETRRRLRELAETSSGRVGPNFVWNREDLYEDRVFPRHERPRLRGDGEAG